MKKPVNDPSRCWPVEEWPDLDQAAWAMANTPSDLFDTGGLAISWAPVTRLQVANGYGRWLQWLSLTGRLKVDDGLVSRATPAQIHAYADALADQVAPFSVQTRIRELGNALRAMAPGEEWNWVTRGADRLRARATSVRDKQSRLMEPGRLAELGVSIMGAAATAATAVRCAVEFRDGLTIALLAYRPIRMRNLEMIDIGKHLISAGNDWCLVFEAQETKACRPMELSFPTCLLPFLEHYLSHHRPVLLDVGARHDRPPPQALWLSSIGQRAVAATISAQIKRRTKAAFGWPLNPHLFRDCAATFIAIAAPEYAGDIAVILGHSGRSISEKHYNHARSFEASSAYQTALAKFMSLTRS